MTPVYKIKINRANVWAKMECENPTGTHKDRSIAPWISYYAKQGISEFAIASSGNSAISAVKYCMENNLELHVFISPHSVALPRLARKILKLSLYMSKTPRRDAIRFCRTEKIVNLRASTDDHALIGYREIARELISQLPKIDNIFIPTSSGATLIGMYDGFLKAFSMRKAAEGPPAFFAVQTSKVHPIASYFDKEYKPEKTSYATAIVDNISYRRDRVIKICQETGGGGFVISNAELGEAREILRGTSDIPHIGWQSALAFAGFSKWKAGNARQSKEKISVCLFTD